MKQLKLIAFLFILGGIMFSACGGQQPQAKKEENNSTSTSDNSQTKEATTNKSKPIYLTKADFLTKITNYEANPNEWKYLGDKPALIDFYADWCGPCKKIAPILEELASEYSEEIYIYKIDVDKETELAQIFGIQSIPSLLFIPMNGNPQMAQGALPKADIQKAINEVVLQKQ